ncbi:NmrA family NAD(P)-binding protein [Actinosynnema mirum]|uniref:NmrA family protein n=1 Tax=Actinosynnema mirum (strain ATCC 29888 / DSM 43827 / JCM 3225 / NBRC 14064 / NCIMB 13271 / NRRL B-12336 / IMRU 3971 / 101) TaxID=446462 RepID=C6W811_ACTMD|nr:NmrA family NAD(P)-binding protein [Actinosynnema mirum]ACU37032.1 NmrA family protein [Actinosynnema mirum DSM 43827]
MAKTLIIGATGTVGGLVLREAVRRGAGVRALVRDKGRADLPDAVELVQGDLADREAVRAALRGVDSAFYVSPHESNEVEIATLFGEEAQRAGARLVFGGFHIEDDAAREAASRAIPAYAPKLELAAFLARTGTRPAMFSLTNFDQNDEVFRADIEAGVFPTPLHPGGVNRIDLRDAAEVITTALTDADFAAGSYQLLGPESLNGEQSARIWAEALGREVVYTGDDPEWRQAFARRLSGRKLADWIRSFELLGSAPIPTDPAEVETMTELLGRAPRTLRDYVRDSVAGAR